MKNNKKAALLAGAFLVIAVVFGAVFFALRPTGSEGKKDFTLEVILSDGSSTEHKISTNAEFVGEALVEEGLLAGTMGDYGMFITAVNGITANEASQEWWCLTIGGESSLYGVDQVPVTDGGHYELTLMVGW